MPRKNTLDRRYFFKSAGILGVGAISGIKQEKEIKTKMLKESEYDHLRFWLDTLLKNIQNSEDEFEEKYLLENCGRACASRHRIPEKAAEVRKKIKDLNDLNDVARVLNENHIGGGNLRKEGELLTDKYTKCYCAIRQSGIISSPIFCECTLGWAKEVYERLWNKPVEVNLLKAIGRGDPFCQITIKP